MPEQLRSAGCRALRLLLLGLLGVASYAGPPFRTDDPQPVDPGHLELYLFAAGQHASGGSSGLGPAVEFNYGFLPDMQFHAIVPYAYNRPQEGPSRTGLGDLEAGLKVRFIHETDTLPQVGLFPLVELPTGRAEQGLGSGHTQVYLPVWAQKTWGAWTTYGGYGWWRNPGEGNRDWHYVGWLLQRDFGTQLTLGAEAFHSTTMTLGGQAASGFNAGGQLNFSEKHHLLFSAGCTVGGARQSSFYLGYQFTTGSFGDLRDWFHRGHAPS
jgi:hypothetical protein